MSNELEQSFIDTSTQLFLFIRQTNKIRTITVPIPSCILLVHIRISRIYICIRKKCNSILSRLTYRRSHKRIFPSHHIILMFPRFDKTAFPQYVLRIKCVYMYTYSQRNRDAQWFSLNSELIKNALRNAQDRNNKRYNDDQKIRALTRRGIQ